MIGVAIILEIKYFIKPKDRILICRTASTKKFILASSKILDNIALDIFVSSLRPVYKLVE